MSGFWQSVCRLLGGGLDRFDKTTLQQGVALHRLGIRPVDPLILEVQRGIGISPRHAWAGRVGEIPFGALEALDKNLYGHAVARLFIGLFDFDGHGPLLAVKCVGLSLGGSRRVVDPVFESGGRFLGEGRDRAKAVVAPCNTEVVLAKCFDSGLEDRRVTLSRECETSRLWRFTGRGLTAKGGTEEAAENEGDGGSHGCSLASCQDRPYSPWQSNGIKVFTMYTTRPAVADDAQTIARFNQAMALETEGKTLDPETLSRGVKRLFDEPEHGQYLVAQSDDGEVVACLMITYEWSDWRDAQVWWIQSVYVHPDHRRKGVFKQLYQAVRELGKAAGVCGYRLYVERDNDRAQQTYRDLGMSRADYLMYEAMER